MPKGWNFYMVKTNMKKHFFTLVITMGLVAIAGCLGTSTPLETPADAETESISEAATETGGQVIPPASLAPTEALQVSGSPFVPIANAPPMEGCTVATLLPGADLAVVSVFPAVSEDDWVRGPNGAAVTLVEYADFQSIQSGQFAPVLILLQQEFPNDLRVVYRHFPQLNTNDKSGLALQAAEAAGFQDKFWEMHDLLFLRQQEWVNLPESDFRTWVTDRTSEIGINSNQFAGAMFSQAVVAMPRQAFADAVQIGIPGVPFLLINGRIYDGPIDYFNLRTIIELYALQSRQYTQCPPMIIDPNARYIVTIQTEKGDIVVELFADVAPLAVNNFIFLATNGWYDNVTFHRVLDGFMAQAGDPSGTGFGGPGYAFKNEISNLSFNSAGLLAMANAGPDSNGSQFFITLGPAPHLDGGFTIFGTVLDGMGVVESLSLRNPEEGLGLPPGDLILTVTIEQR
jgi:cyclophilin family peptidyl-prolyl cis-trans isomerase/protein-disulfide isomerase